MSSLVRKLQHLSRTLVASTALLAILFPITTFSQGGVVASQGETRKVKQYGLYGPHALAWRNFCHHESRSRAALKLPTKFFRALFC